MIHSTLFHAGEDLVSLPFTEPNVLDAIAKISSYSEVGRILQIPPNKLAEIEDHPVADRRQVFVSRLFQCAPAENCNWKKVNSAINQVQISEWAALKGSSSMTKSSSFESLLSSISSGGKKIIIRMFTKCLGKDATPLFGTFFK